MTCIYGCQKDGTPCPRPHTCHTIGMQKEIDEQTRTDRQNEIDEQVSLYRQASAYMPKQPRQQTSDCTRASYGMLDVVKDVTLVLALVGLVAIIGGGLSGFFYELFRG